MMTNENPAQSSCKRSLGFLALAAFSVTLVACGGTDEGRENEVAEVVEQDVDFIKMNGTVVSTTPSSFLLETDTGQITVEMDDLDPEQEGSVLEPGDRVEVTGEVDSNLFTANTIEASAVYVERLGRIFFASPIDEEGEELLVIPAPEIDVVTYYTGWVTGTDEEGFTLGAGPAKITVDTRELENGPLADQIETGDRIHVWGELELDDEGQSRLVADGLYELAPYIAGP